MRREERGVGNVECGERSVEREMYKPRELTRGSEKTIVLNFNF